MNEINGLPVHVLVVHAVVVMIPLTAIVLLLCAFWPAARSRLVWPLLVLATVTMGLVPIATSAGEWLMQHVVITPQAAKHIEIGDSLDVWVIGMFVLAVAIAAVEWFRPRALAPWWNRSTATDDAAAPAPEAWETAARYVVPVLAVLLAVGGVVQVYRVGDSGARAVWQDRLTSSNGTTR